jgi:hypothetical protein
MMVLRNLLTQHPIAFYELVQVCKNPNHKLFGKTGEILGRFAIVQPDGGVHDSIRNIVLSAVEGEDYSIQLTNPVKP